MVNLKNTEKCIATAMTRQAHKNVELYTQATIYRVNVQLHIFVTT